MTPIARSHAQDPGQIPGQIPHPARDPIPDRPMDPVPTSPIDPIPDRPLDPILDRPVDPTAPPSAARTGRRGPTHRSSFDDRGGQCNSEHHQGGRPYEGQFQSPRQRARRHQFHVARGPDNHGEQRQREANRQ